MIYGFVDSRLDHSGHTTFEHLVPYFEIYFLLVAHVYFDGSLNKNAYASNNFTNIELKIGVVAADGYLQHIIQVLTDHSISHESSHNVNFKDWPNVFWNKYFILYLKLHL